MYCVYESGLVGLGLLAVIAGHGSESGRPDFAMLPVRVLWRSMRQVVENEGHKY